MVVSCKQNLKEVRVFNPKFFIKPTSDRKERDYRAGRLMVRFILGDSAGQWANIQGAPWPVRHCSVHVDSEALNLLSFVSFGLPC